MSHSLYTLKLVKARRVRGDRQIDRQRDWLEMEKRARIMCYWGLSPKKSVLVSSCCYNKQMW